MVYTLYYGDSSLTSPGRNLLESHFFTGAVAVVVSLNQSFKVSRKCFFPLHELQSSQSPWMELEAVSCSNIRYLRQRSEFDDRT